MAVDGRTDAEFRMSVHDPSSQPQDFGLFGRGIDTSAKTTTTMMNAPRLLLVASRRAPVVCKETTRSFGSGGGSRGARGHGWWINYRAGKGGRHLQGEYSHLDVEALKAWNDAVFSLGSQFVYMDILMEPFHKDGGDKKEQHRLVLELATEVFPKATQNFTELLQAEQDGYKSTTMHRVEKKVGLLGGHVWKGTGKCFEEFRMPTSATSMEQTEKMVLSHIPGAVTMMSQRVQEIDSRFMLCSHHAPHMDGKAVVIGRLDDESLKKVQEWESTLITQKGHPTTVALRITGCGNIEDKIEESA
jgi:cyclophilin family peptidyl-prolyl cis-trans isomerase